MNYPKNLEEKLEFNIIKEKLAALCCGTLGKDLVWQIRFSNSVERIARLQEQTSELFSIIERGYHLPDKYFNDASAILQQIGIEGSTLDEEQLLQIKNSLGTLHDILKLIDSLEEVSYPRLKELATGVNISSHLHYKLDQTIDENGKIKDTASPKLNALRKQIIDLQTQLRRRLESILKKAKTEGFIHDDANITIRSGRLVIPVLAEAKRKIKGFIHDESATGQTVYMEPAEVLETNNLIRELTFEEHRETVRILFELTEMLRPHVHDLRKAYLFLSQIDFIRAKARLASLLHASFPSCQAEPCITLKDARHPVLFLLHEAQGLRTVPLNLSIQEPTRILVISGPNAGGKSIALKTVGLIQYMFQCGLPIPVGIGTVMGTFDQIMADIGDEQSIENDLSTYSSHLSAMRLFMQRANDRTLFLIDEFGAGTEPQYGGAMAEAILEQLVHKKAYGVVNTHYANLKTFAGRTKGVTNAAMRFDVSSMEPLFELDLGVPGSSFALEIAQKIGIPKNVIANARRKIGIKQINFDRLLSEFELNKKEFEARNAEIKSLEEHLKRLVTQYDKLKQQLESQKKSIIDDARKQAQNMLNKANKEIEKTIRIIKESKAEKTITRQARLHLEKFYIDEVGEPKPKIAAGASAHSVVAPAQDDAEALDSTPIKVGDYVAIQGMDSVGKIVGMAGKDFEVSVGDMKVILKADRLSKISKKAYELKQEKVERLAPSYSGIDITNKLINFDNQLDIRGLRVEEAISILESTLDEALLLGQKELRIVHGKGNGILRKFIREQLKKYHQVKNIADDHADRGGAGVTIVTLK